MPTEEKILEAIKKYVEAINKVSKELGPEDQITNKKIVGLLILQFPEDHKETTHIITTAMGKLCFSHTLELLAQLREGQKFGENKLAA